ncbi:MAG: hypothetical protein AAGH60_00190 [Pseudomonadota bacterium]
MSDPSVGAALSGKGSTAASSCAGGSPWATLSSRELSPLSDAVFAALSSFVVASVPLGEDAETVSASSNADVGALALAFSAVAFDAADTRFERGDRFVAGFCPLVARFEVGFVFLVAVFFVLRGAVERVLPAGFFADARERLGFGSPSAGASVAPSALLSLSVGGLAMAAD